MALLRQMPWGVMLLVTGLIGVVSHAMELGGNQGISGGVVTAHFRYRRSSQSFDQQMLSTINALRRTAGASNMARVEWDADLVRQASNESCETTPATMGDVSFPTSFSPGDTNVSIFNDQQQQYDHTNWTCTSTRTNCSFYLQVVFANVTKVGCASVPCGPNAQPLVRCFFNQKIPINDAPFLSAANCSACPKELSGCDDGLCYELRNANETMETTTRTAVTTTTTMTTTASSSTTAEPTTTANATTGNNTMTTIESSTNATELSNTSTTEPTTMTTQASTTHTGPTADPGPSSVNVMLMPLANVLQNESRISKTLMTEVSMGLNKYCCKNTRACCNKGSNTNVEDCTQFPFIGEDGIRFGQDIPTNVTANGMSMAVYDVYAVTKTNNTLCASIEDTSSGKARKRRALQENEVLVPHKILSQSMSDSNVKDNIATTLTDLGIVVTIPDLKVPVTTPAPTDGTTVQVWIWVLAVIGSLVLVSIFVIIAVLCRLQQTIIEDDLSTEHTVSQYDSRRKLFSRLRPSGRRNGWEEEGRRNYVYPPDYIGHGTRFSSKQSSYRGGSLGIEAGAFHQQRHGHRDVMRGEDLFRKPSMPRGISPSQYTDSAASYNQSFNHDERFNQQGKDNQDALRLFPRIS